MFRQLWAHCASPVVHSSTSTGDDKGEGSGTCAPRVAPQCGGDPPGTQGPRKARDSHLRRPCGPLPAGSRRGTRSGRGPGAPGTCACSRHFGPRMGSSLQSRAGPGPRRQREERGWQVGGGGCWQTRGAWPRASHEPLPSALTPPCGQVERWVSLLPAVGALETPQEESRVPASSSQASPPCWSPVTPGHSAPTAGLVPQDHPCSLLAWDPGQGSGGMSQHRLLPAPRVHISGDPGVAPSSPLEEPLFLDKWPEAQGQGARLLCQQPGPGSHAPRRAQGGSQSRGPPCRTPRPELPARTDVPPQGTA